MEFHQRPLKAARPSKLKGMRLIRGGAFSMGSDAFYEDERPVRRIQVGDFWIDETPVTNGQFGRFVSETAYVTLAETAPNPADYPGMRPEMARAGSAVFWPPGEPLEPMTETSATPPWWRFFFGADWCHPTGPGSAIDGLEDHPVVHVTASDAEAYADWAGKTLPSEAEWEYAARGGLDGATYAWGENFEPDGRVMAKTWQGDFPWRNLAPAGLERTVPVRSFPPNGFDLYDMVGNVWEWTADGYASECASAAHPCCGGKQGQNPKQITGAAPPSTGVARRVTKGGSHLCAPSYCKRYRPAARWPQPIDTSTSHLGFRCIIRR